MLSVFDMDKEQLAALLAEAGEKPYRAGQILGWIYGKFASSWDEMSDLPLSLRQYLGGTLRVSQLELLRKQEGEDEWAKRFLWGAGGKPLCESVLLTYKYGLTGCLSTQSGCPVGCAFCASAILGFDRSLTKGEILEQFIGMCRSESERVGHLVFMGTGEPFMNYENVMAAVDVLCDPGCYGLSRRKVTVSTVGVPDAMRRYGEDCRGARLALSLHAADDETRDRLIPLNKRYPLAEVLEALRDFSTSTGQRVTIEYMLLKGVNDSPAAAARLARVTAGIDCLVNLIPWNEVPGQNWRATEPARVKEFQDILDRNHVKVMVRRKLGANIEAACGQLRREMSGRPSPK